MDDIIVYGGDMAEHGVMLTAVIHRINEAGLKLNKDKCLFRQAQLEYFGHVIKLIAHLIELKEGRGNQKSRPQ